MSWKGWNDTVSFPVTSEIARQTLRRTSLYQLIHMFSFMAKFDILCHSCHVEPKEFRHGHDEHFTSGCVETVD